MTSDKGNKISGKLLALYLRLGVGLTPCSSSRGPMCDPGAFRVAHLATMIGSGWAHDPHQPIIAHSKTITRITSAEVRCQLGLPGLSLPP